MKGAVGEQINLILDIPYILQVIAATTTGTDISGGSNSTSTLSPALIEALLAAAGVDLSNIDLNVNGLVAIQVALAAAGLAPVINITELERLFPGAGLFTVDLTPLLAIALTNAANALTLTSTYTVVEGIASPDGKYQSLLGNVVILEAQHVPALIRGAVSRVVDQVYNVLAPIAQSTGNGNAVAALASVVAALDDLRTAIPLFDYAVMKQYALQVSVMVADREDIYLHNGADAIGGLMDHVADTMVTTALGTAYPVNVVSGVALALTGLQFISLFLTQIFTVTIVMLALLGAVVIYSLILGDVEQRTYEMGMLRALGMKHVTLGQLLAMQTAVLAIPGILLGYLIASLINLGIVAVVHWYAALDVSYALAPSAWIAATLIGSLVPAISVIIPIRRALSTVLRDALDLSHQVISDVTVRMYKLSEMGLSPAQLAFAIMLVLVGFTTFYLLPLSFILNNFGFFLGVLTAILLGMLAGLSILAQALQPWVEHGVMVSILWICRDYRLLGTIVRKALSGHRPRNSKTSYLISITIGFLVFASVMFSLQANSIVTNVRLFLGADIVALIPELGGSTSSEGSSLAGLPQRDMSLYLDGVIARGGPVIDHTWVSFALVSVPAIARSSLSNLVGIPRTNNRVYGVQRNLLSVAYNEFTIVTESTVEGINAGQSGSQSTTAWVTADPVAALYAGAGKLSLSIETRLQKPPSPLGTLPQDTPYFVCNTSSGYLDSSIPWQLWMARIPDNYTTFGEAVAFISNVTVDVPSTAFIDYDYCLLACAHTLTSGWNASSNCTPPSDTGVSTATLAPFYYPHGPPRDTFASASDYAINSTLCIPPPVGSADTGYAPYPLCTSASRFDPIEQADRVTAAYIDYFDVIMSEAMRQGASLSTETPLAVRLRTQDHATGWSLSRVYLAKSRAMVRKLPGFLFSSYSQTSFRSPVIMRMQDLYQIYRESGADYASILQFIQDSNNNMTADTSGTATTPARNATYPLTPTRVAIDTGKVYATSPLLPRIPPTSWSPQPQLEVGAGWEYFADGNSSTTLHLSSDTLVYNGTQPVGPIVALLGTPVFQPTADMSGSASSDSARAVLAGSEVIRANNTLVITIDLGVCALLSGLQFNSWLPRSAVFGGMDRSIVSLYALSDPSARGMQLLTQVAVNTTTSQLDPVFATSDYSFSAFSARWLAVVVTPFSSAASGPPPASVGVRPILAPDLSLVLSRVPTGACQADSLSQDDAVLELPKAKLMVRLRPGSGVQERQRIINGLRSYIRSPLIQVQDTVALLTATEVAVVGLDIFFNLIAALALILAFFSTWLSFAANVSENSVEFGILRALGLPVAAVIRAYIYEAVTVVLSAFLLGTITGLLVAITLTLQFNLFTELPFVFRFPTSLFLLTLLGCVLLSFVSSYLPARRLARIPIAGVVKGRVTA